MRHLNAKKIGVAFFVSSILVTLGVSSSKKGDRPPLSVSSWGAWTFTPENSDVPITIEKLSSLVFQSPQKESCCNGTYSFRGNIPDTDKQKSRQDLEYIYFPALGAYSSKVRINGNKTLEFDRDLSSSGPILPLLEEMKPGTPLSIKVELKSPSSLFSGLWRGPPLMGSFTFLSQKRDQDYWQQSIIPMIHSILFSAMALVFITIFLKSRKQYPYYAMFSFCLVSWSIFYLFLSGQIRSFDLDIGVRFHFAARALAWIGTYLLILSYRHFASKLEESELRRSLTICASIGTLNFVAQIALGFLWEAKVQILLFIITSPLAFYPLLTWRPGKLRFLSFGYTTYCFGWIALIGQLHDSAQLLALTFSNISLPTAANRYTFPLLLGASTFVYVAHFSGVLNKLRSHIDRLKQLNRSALVLVDTNIEKESLSKFSSSLRKAMLTRRCCVARLSENGQYRVIGLAGLSEDAFDSHIDPKKLSGIATAIEKRRPIIAEVEHQKSHRYRSASYAVIPVVIDEKVEFIVLLSDPIRGGRFSSSDLLYLRQFGLMMASHCKQLMADAQFKDLVGHLDESLFRFISGTAKVSINENIATWRGIGYLDQSGFTRTLSKVPLERQPIFLETIKRWAAPAILRHGGRIRSFGGDAYLFDVTQIAEETHKEIMLRLVHILWSLCESIPDLNQKLMKQGFSPVSFRFGGHAGMAHEVNLLDLGVNVTTIVGDAVNMAQRIQSIAPPATVLISETVAREISDECVLSRAIANKARDLPSNTELFRVEAIRRSIITEGAA